MPKPMSIIVHVEEVAFGKVWRTLDTMSGVVKLELHSEAKGAPRPNGGPNDNRNVWRQPGGFNYRQAVLALIAKGPASIDAIKKLATDNGREANAAGSALNALKKHKWIKSNGKGVWSLTPSGKSAFAKQQAGE